MPKITTFPAADNIPVYAEVADRVEFIADLMEGLCWKRGKSAKVLAKAWNLSKSTVESYSAEASRQVTADRDTAARDISVICSELMKSAYLDGRTKDAAMIGKLWADVSGANAPAKQEVQINTDANARELMGRVFRTETGKDAKELENDSDSELEPINEPNED